MKFSNETLKILKNFLSINPSIVFKPGKKLSTMSPSKTIMASVDISEEIPQTFGIYDLSKLLGVLSLFSDPDLELEEKKMVIKEGKKRINYTFTEPSLIVSPPEKEIKFPEAEVNFRLEEAHLKELRKAQSVLSLPEYAIIGDGKKVYAQAIDSKNPTSDIFSIEVGETNDNFKMIILADNLKIVDGDYNVSISSKGLSKFDGSIKYYIAVEQHSEFKGN